MPTGSGKSLCYQLPALMRHDLTLVVSPLVSLMQDQVDALKRIAPGRVALINSQQDSQTNRRALDAAVRGDLRLLYVAPERFSSPGFVEKLRGASVGLFVVDEAHCVSQWGHDFRPDYFRLADAARWLGSRSIVASTATATPEVARDIVDRLGLRDPVHVATGFDRPNLTFCVVPAQNKEAGHRGIAAALGEPDALPAIVYAGTRAECEKLSGRLSTALDTKVLPYHAGLPRDVRAETQRKFMSGEIKAVVATNAFGMGVDKADVRTVCHESVPGSIEAYYQEAGRAGRDGRPARCLLFASSRDKGLHVFFIERATVDEGKIAAVARRVLGRAADGRYDVGMDELCHAAGDGDGEQVRAILGHLARAGVLQPAPSPPDRAFGRVIGDVGRCGQGTRAHLRDRGDEGALAPVPQRVGLGRGLQLPALGHPAPLRRPRRAHDRPRRPLLRRLQPGGSARAATATRAGRRPSRAPVVRAAARCRRARRRDPVRRRVRRARRSAAPVPSRSCAEAARRSSSSTPTTGCPSTGPTGILRRRGPRPRRCADDGRHAALDGRALPEARGRMTWSAFPAGAGLTRGQRCG